MLQYQHMNKKVAKKIGEAYAFAQVLQDTYQSNESVMKDLFGLHAEGINKTVEAQIAALHAVSEETEMTEVVVPKAERTGGKISKMADMYVGDEWDNPVEVLEWMSFFVGGAIVHWQLIAGSGEAMGHEGLHELASNGVQYYSDLMEQLRKYAVEVGKDRALG
ncbi:MAG: hypothetical protein ACI88L_000590 [Candidatus Paceibacteria bacterium]|jgi:hypothetical protein